jgi:hypothetical protein
VYAVRRMPRLLTEKKRLTFLEAFACYCVSLSECCPLETSTRRASAMTLRKATDSSFTNRMGMPW